MVFERYTRWILLHPKRTLGRVCFLVLICLGLALTLKVNTNILELLPPNEPSTLAVKRLQAEEGEVGTLTIAVKGAEKEVQSVFAKMEEEFDKSEMVEFAVYDVPTEWKEKLGPLQLDVKELKHLRSRLGQALALGPNALNPMMGGQLFDLGPLTEKLTADTEKLAFGDDGVYRILVRPKGSAFDPKFSLPFWEFSNEVINSSLKGSQVELVWIGGAYRHAVEDREIILKDISKTASISLVFVLLLVALAFRDVRAIVILFVPLLLGAIGTWGFAAIAIGELNTFTSTFTAILFGLGVDFSIHLYSRYREEFAEIGDVDEAIVKAMTRAGPPCLTAAVTSAGGFLALRFAGFVGFQQLGILLATGVLFCLFAVVTTLPLMIKALDPKKQDSSLLRPPFQASVQVKYQRSAIWLAVIGLIGISSWKVIPDINFEYDLSELRPDGLAYDELSEMEQNIVRKSFRPLIVTLESDEELLQLHQKMEKVIENKESPYFREVFSVYSILPSDQQERVSLLKDIQQLHNHENIGFMPKPVQSNLKNLASSDIDVIKIEDLPSDVLGVLGIGVGKHRLVIMPDGNMWDIRENSHLQEEVDRYISADFQQAEVAGEYLAMASLFRLIQTDGTKISLLALLFVFFFSLWDIGSIKRAISSVLILLVGMSWAGAGVYFANVNLSLVNFVAIPIIMGIGIDVIIHLLHRISEEGPGRINFALRTTGFASFISATTTVVSFASLLFASNRGLHSLGEMVVVGLSLVTMVAFMAVPLGWMSTWFRRKQVPQELLNAEE